MRDKVIATKNNNQINLYLISGGQKHWLFTLAYSKSVYNYFKAGRSLTEVMKYKNWKKSPRLTKTIERLPGMIKYVKKEFGLYNPKTSKNYNQKTRYNTKKRRLETA